MSRTIPILAVALALAANSRATAQRAGDTQSQGQNQQEDPLSDADQTPREELPDQDQSADSGDDRTQLDGRANDSLPRESQPQEFDFGARFTDADDALTVGSVAPGTLGAEIGLRQDDRVLAVGERAVFTQDDFNRAIIQSRTSRERIPIVVRRDSGRTTLYVQPETLRNSFGLSRRPIAPDLGVVLVPGAADELVVRDVSGGIGSRLGLRANDVVVSVGGRRIASPTQFERLISDVDFAGGRPLPVVVVRDGRRVTLYLESEGRDYDDPGENSYRDQSAWLGVTLDANYDNAAVVQSVISNSPAAEAGVRPGDWIVRIDGRRVNSPGHLTSLVRSMDPGEELEIQIARRVSQTLVARLDSDPSFQRRQALRPTYEFYDGDDIWTEQPRIERPDAPFDPDLDRRGLRDRVGPGERGVRDRLDADEIRDEPRGVLPR